MSLSSLLQSKYFKGALSACVLVLTFISLTAFAAWSSPISTSDSRSTFLNLGPVTQVKTGRLNVTTAPSVITSAKFEVAGAAQLAGGVSAGSNTNPLGTAAIILGDVYVGYQGSPLAVPSASQITSSYKLNGSVMVSRDIKAGNLAHGNAGSLEQVCTDQLGWLIPCTTTQIVPTSDNVACWYNTNSTGSQTNIVTEGSCSGSNCTNTTFTVPTGVNAINVLAVGPGGGGASYSQYSEFGFEIYSAGQGEIGGGDDGSGDYGSGSGGSGDGINLVDRVSMQGRAGSAGGNGALVGKTALVVTPGESFSILTGKGGISDPASVDTDGCGFDCDFAPSNIRSHVTDTGAHPIPGLEDQATFIPGDAATQVMRSADNTFVLARGGLGAPKNNLGTGMFTNWQAAWQTCNSPVNNGGQSGLLTGVVDSLATGTSIQYTTTASPSVAKSGGCGSGWAALQGSVSSGAWTPNFYANGNPQPIVNSQYSVFSGLPFAPGLGGQGGQGGQGGGYSPQSSDGESGMGGAVCISWEQ